ncbi:hypothetical protein AGIG_G9211 [Arapaima gigas]
MAAALMSLEEIEQGGGTLRDVQPGVMICVEHPQGDGAHHLQARGSYCQSCFQAILIRDHLSGSSPPAPHRAALPQTTIQNWTSQVCQSQATKKLCSLRRSRANANDKKKLRKPNPEQDDAESDKRRSII